MLAYALHQYFSSFFIYIFWCHLACQLAAIWWTPPPPLFTFHDETEGEKFGHWWWGKMKSAPLKCKRSVGASEHYGVPFSSINLPIFHGCGGLFIDQWMIKWWSTEGPSSFSFLFFSHPFSFLLILYTFFFFPSLCVFIFSLFLPILLFSIIIYRILHTKLLSHSLVVREIILESRGRMSPSIPFFFY